jgi:hypothetical protein
LTNPKNYLFNHFTIDLTGKTHGLNQSSESSGGRAAIENPTIACFQRFVCRCIGQASQHIKTSRIPTSSNIAQGRFGQRRKTRLLDPLYRRTIGFEPGGYANQRTGCDGEKQ